MAATKRGMGLGKGLEDRKDRQSIRARTRRADARGELRDISQTFPYDPALPAGHRMSRSSAIEAARAWITEQQRALRRDKAPVGERVVDLTLGGLVDRYAREIREGLPAGAHHVRKKGAKKELSVLRGWEATFPGLMAKPCDEVIEADVRRAMRVLQFELVAEDGSPNTLMPSTINRWVAVLSAVFTAAITEWDLQLRNPVRGLRAARPDNAKQMDRVGRLITAEELEKVLAHVPTASPETKACLRFLRWSGCRRSEAVRLDWGDLDWSKAIPEVTFRETKDPRGRIRHRTIPLDDRAVEALRSLVEEGRDPPTSGRIFPMAVDTPTQAFERGCLRAGIKDARLHDLRHTRVTEIASALPIHDAMKISGHLDTRTLDRYYHPDPQELGRRLNQAKGEGPNEHAKLLEELRNLIAVGSATAASSKTG